MQHHDGLIDIINQANYITISNSVFKDHDKAHVIGNSDRKEEDRDHLKVTLRHNLFENVMQRTPRVRFGEVHAYNNYYRGKTDDPDYPFRYAFGIGKEARLFAESNAFDIKGPDESGVAPADLMAHYRGEVFQASDTLLNGEPVDILASFAEANPDKALGPDVGWKPTLYAAPPLSAADVADHVLANAGPGKL
jgi:pectate lyase